LFLRRTCPPPVLLSFPTRRSSDLQPAPLRFLVVRIGGVAHALHPLVLEVRVLRPVRKDEQQAHFIVAVVEIVEPPLHIFPVHVPDRKSTRLNSSHVSISYAVFCLK